MDNRRKYVTNYQISVRIFIENTKTLNFKNFKYLI